MARKPPPSRKGTRNPNAGRKKGVPNKRTLQAKEIAEQMGVDPLKVLLWIASGDWRALGYKRSRRIVAYSMSGKAIYEDVIKMDHRAACASRAMPFLYAQRRAEDALGKVSDAPELPSEPKQELIETTWVVKQVTVAAPGTPELPAPQETKTTEREVKDVINECYDPPQAKKA